MSGLDDFKGMIREYRNLAFWAAGGSVLMPFIASFLSVIPPWPRRLDLITSVLQLLALVIAFQNFSRLTRSQVTKAVNLTAAGAVVSVLGYLFLFSNFAVLIPQTGEHIVIGFRCTAKALTIPEYRDACPFLGQKELMAASYVEYELWTRWSISVVRLGLLAMWLLFFACFAISVGAFLTFQMRNKRSRLKVPKS